MTLLSKVLRVLQRRELVLDREKDEIARMNATQLAYMGDAVYEVKIRQMLISKSEQVDNLHTKAIKYVNAVSQARAAKILENTLEDTEREVFRRARNKKQKTKPKNVDHVTYKYATALEALLGYLYLTDDTARLDEIIIGIVDLLDGHGDFINEKEIKHE